VLLIFLYLIILYIFISIELFFIIFVAGDHVWQENHEPPMKIMKNDHKRMARMDLVQTDVAAVSPHVLACLMATYCPTGSYGLSSAHCPVRML
jgi:hypothetical protein